MGTAKDEQGGVLQNVALTLVGRTGPAPAATDAAGTYRFPAVDPGSYELKAEAAGFNNLRKTGIVIPVGGTIVVDLVLKLAGMAESLEVVDRSAVLDPNSAATSNALSEDLLFNMPLGRFAVTLLNATPGVNDDTAFGGGQGRANAMLLDGVDTRDPLEGGPWVYMNYNIIQEVQVQGLGAPAEYGGFTGAVVNTVTRSGGNRLSGLLEVRHTRSSLASGNVSADIAARNPGLAAPASTRKLLDGTAQLSGPIRRDTLFFFVNLQRYELDIDPPGPRTFQHEISSRFNGKLSWQPRAQDHLMAMVQYDRINVRNFGGVPPLLATDDLALDVGGPETVWNVQWRHLFGSKAFLDARYVGWSSVFEGSPRVTRPGHFDGATGAYSVSAGYSFRADRGRHQANLSLTRYAEAFGRHDLKFGLEIERGRARDRFAYVDDISYYDYSGAPYLAQTYSYDVTARNVRESAYLQDSWRIGPRLTVNPGARLDRIRGENPDVGKVYQVLNLAPRIGLAFDLTGDRSSVLRATYGHYYEAPFATFYRRALPGFSDFVVYDNAGPSRAEIERTPPVLYSIDSGIAHPRVDEFTLGIERALTGDLRLALTGIRRRNKNFIDSVFPQARWVPVSVTNLVTDEPMTVYRWANRPAAEDSPLIANVDGLPYRDPLGNVIGTARAWREYRGLMLVATRRFRGSWQIQASYVLSSSEGTVDNRVGNSIGSSKQFESATTALVNVRGKLTSDRRHELKLLASWKVPGIDVGLHAFFRSLSGRNYTPFQRLPQRTIDFPQGAGRQLRLEARGSRRLESENALDVRIDKAFKLGGGRLGVYVDITNVFNSSTILSVQAEVPSVAIDGVAPPVLFGAPTAIIEPRQLILAVRWSL